MAPIGYQKVMRCGIEKKELADIDPTEVTRIIGIKIYPNNNSRDYVAGVSVVFQRNNGKEMTCTWGDTNQRNCPALITLESNEYIAAVSGTYTNSCMEMLRVDTNLGNFCSIGTSTTSGKPFALPAVNGQIASFHVRYHPGYYFYAIGTYVKAADWDYVDGPIYKNAINKVTRLGRETGDVGDVDLTRVRRITSIGIHPDGSAVGGLTVRYEPKEGIEITSIWGNTRNKPREITFKPNEYIIAITGYYTSSIISIKLETNIRTFGPIGEERGTPFVHQAFGGQIVGLHACYTEEYLGAVGVYTKAINGETVRAGAISGNVTTAPFDFQKLTRFGNEIGYVGDIDLTLVQRVISIGIHPDDSTDDGPTVGGLSVHYQCNDGTEMTRAWGNTSSQPSQITLIPDEYIRAIRGRYTTFVCSLKVETNLQTCGIFDSKIGTPFELPAFGGQIFGFHTRFKYNTNLQAIGAYVKAISTADGSETGGGTANGDATSRIGATKQEPSIDDVVSTAAIPLLKGLQQEKFHLYLQQNFEGPKKNSVGAFGPNLSNHFGHGTVDDWPLLDGPGPSAKVVARAHGLSAQCSSDKNQHCFYHNIVFQDGRLAKSTLQVQGLREGQLPGSLFEWSIVGGTGEFTFAHGTIYGKVSSYKDQTRTIQLFIHVYYCPVQKPQLPW